MKFGKRALLAEIAIGILFVVLSVAMTWPLARSFRQVVADPSDPYINSWILDWDWYATLHQPLSLFEANVFYPAHHSLAYSENLYGIALLLFPFRAAGVAPLTAYNIAMLAGYACSGFAAYLLGHHLSKSVWAGVAAGVFYAFLPFRFTHASHVQHVWGAWLPLLLLMLFRYQERPTWGRAAAFGAVFLMNGLTNIHALLFGTLAIAATALLLRPKPLPLAVCTTVAGILLLPFLMPYIEVAKLYGMQRGWRETKLFSALPGDWLVSNTANHLYRVLQNTAVNPERWLFPGFLCLAVGAFAVAVRSRAAATALLWIVLGFVGSLGTHNIFHRFLFRHVIGFRAIRVPARWAMIAYAGLAIAVALGTGVLSRKRPWIGALIAAAFVVELWSAPFLWYIAIPEPPAVYAWIAAARPRAIVELPMGGDFDYQYMLYATAHHRPMLNGVSGFAPPEYLRLAASAQRNPIPDTFVDELRRTGCELVIVHTNDAPVREWLAREIARGRLAYERHFDSDWVFRLGGTPRPDPQLDAFLRGEPTFNERAFGMLDEPKPGAHLRGGAKFSGWAMSPYGLREVNLLFNNGRIRRKAALSANPYLNRVFPFYDVTTRPVFTLEFTERPKEMWQWTDVQTEIVDGHGRSVRLPDRFIEWQ